MRPDCYDVPIDSLTRIVARSGQSLEANGLFASGFMAMLDLQRPLPADDKRASKILCTHVTTYRRLLKELLADGSFVRLPSGEITAPLLEECRPSRATSLERIRRAPIPADTREAVYAKTGGKCVYCAIQMTLDAGQPTSFEPDHVLPVARGGPDDIANLIPSCRSCNAKKRAQTALQFLSGGGA